MVVCPTLNRSIESERGHPADGDEHEPSRNPAAESDNKEWTRHEKEDGQNEARFVREISKEPELRGKANHEQRCQNDAQNAEELRRALLLDEFDALGKEVLHLFTIFARLDLNAF